MKSESPKQQANRALKNIRARVNRLYKNYPFSEEQYVLFQAIEENLDTARLEKADEAYTEFFATIAETENLIEDFNRAK